MGPIICLSVCVSDHFICFMEDAADILRGVNQSEASSLKDREKWLVSGRRGRCSVDQCKEKGKMR